MAQTIVELCNAALTKVGAELILSLDDDTPSSNVCKQRYEPVKRLILRKHPWNCATKRLMLASLADVPEFGFGYKFAIPGDCLRVLSVDDGYDYVVEGRYILYDETTLELKYIWDVDTPAVFDSMLDEAIAAWLAWDICYKLTQSTTMKQLLYEEAKQAVKWAKTPDAQEEAIQTVEANYYLDSRIAGTGSDPREPKRDW